MKALWLAPTFWPVRGGIETISGHLALGLSAAGHQLLVITDEGFAPGSSPSAPDDLPVQRLPIRRALTEPNAALTVRIQRRVGELAAEFEPDLIHLHLVGPAPMGFFYLRLADAQPVPLVITVHDDIGSLRAGGDTVLGGCLNRAARVAAWSQTVLDEVLNLVPGLAGRAAVIYPGLPEPPQAPKAGISTEPRLLCLGRLTIEKGVDLALSAFARIAAAFPTARLVIAGEGPARPALERQALELGLDDTRLEFTGPVTDDERGRLYDSALAVLMPSRHREGFGLVALEAAQHGRAIIAARAGALSEAVGLLENGLLTPQEDVSALADAMGYLLAHPAEAQRLGEAGRRMAGLRFRQDVCVSRYAELYRQLMSQP
jgi:glycogen(starch) synthase